MSHSDVIMHINECLQLIVRCIHYNSYTCLLIVINVSYTCIKIPTTYTLCACACIHIVIIIIIPVYMDIHKYTII